MKKISKILCIALSMTLLINLAGFEVLAADVNSQNNDVTEAENNTEKQNVTDNGTTNEENNTESKNADQDAVITDEDVNSNEDDVQDVTGTDKTDTDSEELSEDSNLPASDEVAEPSEEAKELDPQVVTTEEITVKPNNDNTKLVVDWSNWTVTDVDNYEVAVKDSKDAEVQVADKTEKTATFAATPGEKYTISIDAKKNDGTSIEKAEIPAILLAAPSNIAATAGDTTVNLSWNPVAGATEYKVAYEGKEETVGGTAYTASKLTNGTKYSFNVTAVCKYADNRTYTSPAGTVEATPKSKVPAKVTGLTAIDGEKSAILTWSKATRAASYVIYRYNSSKKTWDVVKKNVTKLTYTDTKLSSGKKYKYRVAAMNDGGIGAQSDSVSVSVKKTPGTKVRTIGYKAIVKSRAPLFTSKSSKKRVKYLKKGTRVTTIDYGKGRYQIKLSDGKTYWLSKDRLTFTASIWTTKDYSTKVKEDFVNKKGYKSPSKYLIWINAYTQRVMIFQGKKGKWKMIRNCRCATGTHLHPTPKGTFKITYKEKGWFYRSTYEKPIVHFKSQNSFHSRIKNYKGGYADATIGKPRSKGCVRLYDADINFIYKKCPKGTTVVSH